MRDSGRSSVHETRFVDCHPNPCFMQLFTFDKLRWRLGYVLHPGTFYGEQLARPGGHKVEVGMSA